MKITIHVIFATAALSACSAAVVADRPVGEATLAPASPGPTYVWINDSWNYNRDNQIYVMQPGYWTEPKRNATWVDGRWVKTKRGWKYAKGYWKYK